ncbi:MAG: glucosaminidase domain-containing protein [Prevotellaceae bacterium]|jgi:hypothetical protein|nr:glucosaminidase domain-containing protein [Prevotellaceae bacterium]
MSRNILFFFLILLLPATLPAQRRTVAYTDYIETYREIAVEQMRKHKIPASITLAQGLLESGAGRSTLARRSHNHFGIKCGGGWTGRSVRHTDDAPNECFRAYRHPRESYEDHSAFLVNGRRYAFLFELKPTDYRGWAKGLKRAGYATDPSYANRLIQIIEDYELYKYDTKALSKREQKRLAETYPTGEHVVYIANGMAYVVARDGDTFRALGKELDISWRKLVKYNDLHKEYTLTDGDIIYLRKKKRKADKPYTVHIVREGESMHLISQIYGIRLKNLYKMNRKDGEYIPEIGDRLRLR